jgi:bifunctional enzyme Fae/Hps
VINAYSDQTSSEGVYLIGEALMGEEPELAHIDLIIGDKQGPVGQAFATGLTNLSQGHTPLLAVIRPNLPTKPYTLLIPKVTVRNMDQAGKIFGPAQAAVAKAVADAVEEGVIPRDKLESWIILCSVFIHPKAEDYRRIYHYNYGATKLALKRALSSYPPLDKILYDKDRAKHPVMGFRVPRLWRPPYLQIALDITDMGRVKKIVEALPKNDRIILEVGSPLIKRYGLEAVKMLREVAVDSFIVADLKTMDVGNVEADLAYDSTADAAVVAGVAAKETIDKFVYEANRLGMCSVIDMMEVPDPIEKLKSLKAIPKVICLHRPIDVERTEDSKSREEVKWDLIPKIRKAFPKEKLLFAVAGGISPQTAPAALGEGADIIVVGRYITQARDVREAATAFLPIIGGDIDLFRAHTE